MTAPPSRTGRAPGVDVRRLAAPALAVVGLVVIGVLSLDLLTGTIPSLLGGGGGDGGPVKTPTPSNIVVVDPRTKVPGSILYVKAGNIWLQSGVKATQLTNSGRDSMPAWAPDGSAIYYIHVEPSTAKWRIDGETRTYLLDTPTLMRMAPTAGATPEVILTGEVHSGSLTWSYFIREPAISPDGTLAAVVSDGPDPGRSDVVLQFVDLAQRGLVDPKLPQFAPLGHQDPAWSPDGRYVLYVKNGRDGSRGAATIQRYDRTTKKVSALTGPGYIAPAYSPDGRFVAATKTDSFGTDVVILDATTGAELMSVTRDEHSFAPAWSPAGDSLAYLTIDGGVVDLFLVRLKGSGPAWSLDKPLQLTYAAGLDAGSRLSWYIPADQLPKPTASPTPTLAPSSPTGSATPGPSL